MGRLLMNSLRCAKTSIREDDIGESLSSLEKELWKNLYRLEIKGKRDRAVHVLLTKQIKDHLNFLTSTKEEKKMFEK